METEKNEGERNMTISLTFMPWRRSSFFIRDRGWLGFATRGWILMNTPAILNSEARQQMVQKSYNTEKAERKIVGKLIIFGTNHQSFDIFFIQHSLDAKVCLHY